jgi:FkbM family methyltransferase
MKKKIFLILNIFKRTNLITATKISIIFILNKVFFTRMRLSFSQFGEDLIIENLINKKNGIYVDVGCNDPISGNNFFKLYLLGWKGICIDGNIDVLKNYKKIRPNDIVVNELISEKEKELVFYISDDNKVSTGSETQFNIAKEKWKFNETNKKILVAKTLTQVLDIYLDSNYKIDVLSIDVEGMDFEVLLGLNLKKYTPKIIIIELGELNKIKIEDNNIYKLLTQMGYKLISQTFITSFFIYNEE